MKSISKNVKSDFLWGTLTTAFQCEGALRRDGRGSSIWDIFSHTHGKIKNNENADISCDFYDYYKDDIKLMKSLGYKAHSLSISWSRIFPLGKGKINKNGIDFYKNVLEELKNNNIKTFVTLYHWDLPQALQEKGGWLNKETPIAFSEYANFCFKELGNLVDFWVTLNEPSVSSFFSYYMGVFPPEIKDTLSTLKVIHNLIFAHGLAVQKFRNYNYNSKIGIKLDKQYSEPFDLNNINDIYAKRFYDALFFESFSDTIFFGDYPSSFYRILNKLGSDIFVTKKDLDIISQKIDFLGLDYYTRQYIKYDEAMPLNFSIHLSKEYEDTLNNDTEFYPYENYPEGLYKVLSYLGKRYSNIPIFVTENGRGVGKEVTENNIINDDYRIKYLEQHIKMVKKAIKEGIDIKGYFVWSFLDCFEWNFGFGVKFGLVHVDFKTQKRTPKESAYWYSKFIKNY